MSNEVGIVATNIAALSNTYRPLFKVPVAYGGITIVGGNAVMGGSANSGLTLVDLGTAGTSYAGTIAAQIGGTAAWATGVPLSWTITTPFISGGHWVGVKETNLGAANAITIVNVNYVMGK